MYNYEPSLSWTDNDPYIVIYRSGVMLFNSECCLKLLLRLVLLPRIGGKMCAQKNILSMCEKFTPFDRFLGEKADIFVCTNIVTTWREFFANMAKAISNKLG